jgi:hypothetical protein
MAVAEHAAGSAIDTKRVAGRRQPHYNSVDDLLADAQKLAQSPHRTLGNWSLGMILKHLANTFTMGIDGGVPPAPWILRTIARTVMKRRMLRGPMPAGYKLPPSAARTLMAGPTSSEEGLAALRTAIGRWKTESKRSSHPFFGNLTPDEWTQLQLRHAELHMSFVVPEERL